MTIHYCYCGRSDRHDKGPECEKPRIRDLTQYEKAISGIDERARDKLIAGLKRSSDNGGAKL